MRRTLLGAAATLSFAATDLAGQDVTRTGKTFVVTLHPGKLGEAIAARLADEALAAAESARPMLEKAYQRPAKPPTIHLWADSKEYEAVAKEPKYDFVRNAVCRPEQAASHVRMRPLLTERLFDELGLPESIRNDVVLQAAMLTACDRAALARNDIWFAEVFAAGVLEAVVFADGRDGVDPIRDSRFWYLTREAKAGKPRPFRSLWQLSDPVASAAEYDYVLQGNAAIGRLLASAGSGWAKKLLNVKVKDSDSRTEWRAAALQAVLGGDEKRHEERFAKLLSSSSPLHYVVEPLAVVRGGRILLAAGKQQWAGIGGAMLPPPAPYTLRATVEIVPSGPNPGTSTAAIRLDETEISVVEIECKAGQITVGLRERGADKAVSDRFDAPIELGKPFALSIEVRDAARVAVFVDGEQIADVPFSGRTFAGEWRIMKLDGIVWLENMRCEPLGAPAKK